MADTTERKELKDAVLASRGYILPFGRTEDGSMTFAVPQVAYDVFSALKLPGDVAAGRVDPMSDEAIGRSFDLAGALTLGAGAIPAQANSLRAGIKAYHGSPHDFDKFDMSKIGTGEGNQVFGHGLYFSETPVVAKAYRDGLLDARIPEVNDRLRNLAKEMEAISTGYRQFRPGQEDAGRRLAAEYDALLAERVGMRGRMYEVNIHADPDRLLDWDVRGPKQSPEVQGAIRDIAAKYRLADPVESGRSPASLLSDLSHRDVTGSPAAAAAALSDRGIPGIKYLDQASRVAGKPPRNFVVFDPEIIEIVKKYGIVAALAGGLLTQEEADQLAEQGY